MAQLAVIIKIFDHFFAVAAKQWAANEMVGHVTRDVTKTSQPSESLGIQCKQQVTDRRVVISFLNCIMDTVDSDIPDVSYNYIVEPY